MQALWSTHFRTVRRGCGTVTVIYDEHTAVENAPSTLKSSLELDTDIRCVFKDDRSEAVGTEGD
jgi:ABC-type thiamine transport system substrate-binding protein